MEERRRLEECHMPKTMTSTIRSASQIAVTTDTDTIKCILLLYSENIAMTEVQFHENISDELKESLPMVSCDF